MRSIGDNQRFRYSSDAIDGTREVVVSDGRVARLDWPQRFAELANSCRRVEHDFGAVQAIHEPIKRMVSTVTDVDRYSAELSLEDGMTQSTLHIVSRLLRLTLNYGYKSPIKTNLIEVADSWNVILPSLSDHFSSVRYNDCSVPHNIALSFIPLQNRRHNNHIVFSSQFLQELSGWACFSALGKL